MVYETELAACTQWFIVIILTAGNMIGVFKFLSASML